MTAHRSLLAVVWRFSGRETRSDEVLAVTTDRVDAFLGDVLPIRCRQVKPGTELRLLQPCERYVVVLHLTVSNSSQRTARWGQSPFHNPGDQYQMVNSSGEDIGRVLTALGVNLRTAIYTKGGVSALKAKVKVF